MARSRSIAGGSTEAGVAFSGGTSPDAVPKIPPPLPVPLLLCLTQHTDVSQACLSSVNLNGSFGKAGSLVCFVFCSVPSAENGTCTQWALNGRIEVTTRPLPQTGQGAGSHEEVLAGRRSRALSVRADEEASSQVASGSHLSTRRKSSLRMKPIAEGC